MMRQNKDPQNAAETVSPEFVARYSDWKLVYDFAHSENLLTYIRVPFESEPQHGNEDYRSQAYHVPRESNNAVGPLVEAVSTSTRYKEMAVYTDVTGSTLDAMSGLAFLNEPEIVISPQLDPLMRNSDGSGLGLIQNAKELLQYVLMFGRVGVLVDFPKVNGSIGVDDAEIYHPTLVPYSALDIREWRIGRIGSVMKTKMLLLSVRSRADTLKGELIEDRLELGVDERGYYQRTWREIKEPTTNKKSWQIIDETVPVDASGQAFDFIPWLWCGSENNSHRINKAPLLPIAKINKAHYNNSASQEDGLFQLGSPQAWVSGFEQDQIDQLVSSGFKVGSNRLLPIPAGGSFEFAQLKPNDAVQAAMDNKMKQMLALGARIIEPSAQQMTATESNSQDVRRNSALSLACANVSECVSKALDIAQMFSGGMPPERENADAGNLFLINTEFAVKQPSAVLLASLMDAWVRGGVALSDLHSWQVDNNLTTLPFDEWRQQLNQPNDGGQDNADIT